MKENNVLQEIRESFVSMQTIAENSRLNPDWYPDDVWVKKWQKAEQALQKLDAYIADNGKPCAKCEQLSKRFEKIHDICHEGLIMQTEGELADYYENMANPTHQQETLTKESDDTTNQTRIKR